MERRTGSFFSFLGLFLGPVAVVVFGVSLLVPAGDIDFVLLDPRLD